MYEKQKTPPQQLTLSTDKKVLGVVGGIAKYFGFDKALARIIAAILVIMSGIVPGVLVYLIIGAVIKPEAKPRVR
ncbi:PspC domain-containing protein [Candidatus Saccharibacteria bacterium]|nr:PspC domain-containing protein [Candidatus Saccharibacteria bacterium]